MAYIDQTLEKLFSLCGNVCAFPQCTAPIIDSSSGVRVGEICHIKGKRLGSARYDRNQPKEERDSYENLIVMCRAHHKIIDDKKTRDQYPVGLLRKYKVEHETQFQNTIVRADLLTKFVASFRAKSIGVSYNQSGGVTAGTVIYHPPPPQKQVNLVPEIEWKLAPIPDNVGIDYYDFNVSLHNAGETTVRDFCVTVEIPNAHAKQSGINAAEVQNRPNATSRLYRQTPEHLAIKVLYPSSTQLVLQLTYIVTRQQYKEGINESITVSIYADDRCVNKHEYAIASMVNQERRAYWDSR